MQKGFTPIIILVGIIILIAAASGIYYFQKQQAIKKIRSFEECAKVYPVMESYPARCATPDGRTFVQQLSEEEKKKTLPPTNEKSNWKTYTNSEHGYSIRYPVNFHIENEKKEDGYLQITNFVAETGGGAGYDASRDKGRLAIEIWIFRKSERQSLSDWIKKSHDESRLSGFKIEVLNEKEVFVDNHEAIREEADLSGYMIGSLYVAKDESTIVSINGYVDYIGMKENFNQILATLKFLTTSPSPSSTSKNQCGDGVCQEVVCLAVGCPKPETPQSCPADCK